MQLQDSIESASPRHKSSKQCNDVFLLFLFTLSLCILSIVIQPVVPGLFDVGVDVSDLPTNANASKSSQKVESLVVREDDNNGNSNSNSNSPWITIGGGEFKEATTVLEVLPKTKTKTTNATKTVAYAVSFIKCKSENSNAANLVDASLVLRHSIHNISVRNPNSGSKYDYKMYAIVHKHAEACSQSIKRAGFEVIVVDPPVLRSEIRGDLLRKRVGGAFCCGEHEFVKLYAYNKFPEELFVHTDIDFAFFKPMDHLFDAMLFDKDSKEGKLARSKIERERDTDEWPDRIDAFITRDWHQVAPNKYPPGYQAGFVVGRRNPQVFDEVIEIIKEGNYSKGWGWTSGWGGKGYGGYVGAMAMQGLMGYYYDHIRPNTAVELNQCRYNHMGLDIRYNGPKRWGKKGMCRNNHKDDVCEDCMVTEPELIYSAHYTQCRKPWACIAVGFPGGKKPNSTHRYDFAIDTNDCILDHCMMLLEKWHFVRHDLETKLWNLTGDDSILQEGRNGTYRSDVFLGHCTEDGKDGYIKLSGKEESYARFHELYG